MCTKSRLIKVESGLNILPEPGLDYTTRQKCAS